MSCFAMGQQRYAVAVQVPRHSAHGWGVLCGHRQFRAFPHLDHQFHQTLANGVPLANGDGDFFSVLQMQRAVAVILRSH